MANLQQMNGAAKGVGMLIALVLLVVGGWGAIQASIAEAEEAELIWDVYWEPGMGSNASTSLSGVGTETATLEVNNTLRQTLVVKVASCTDTRQANLDAEAMVEWTVTNDAGESWSGSGVCSDEETWEFATTESPVLSEMLARDSEKEHKLEEITHEGRETGNFTIEVTITRGAGTLPISPQPPTVDAEIEFHYHTWEPTFVERAEEELVR